MYFSDHEVGLSPGFGLEYQLKNGIRLMADVAFSINLYPVSHAWGSTATRMMSLDFQAGVLFPVFK
jgi:hypothetical protein